MRKQTAALALVGSIVFGAGAYAYAEGQPNDPATSDAPADASVAPDQGARRRHRPPMPLVRRAIHADLLVPGESEGTWETVTLDRGEVTAVSATSITLRRADGTDVTKTISENTTFRGVSGPDEVQVGEPAIVKSDGDAALTVAQRTGERRPPAERRRRNFAERGNVDGSGSVENGEAQVPAA